MNNLIIFASGGGSNFIRIYKNTLNNKIENSKVTLLVSNNPNCKAVEFAKHNEIDTFIINNIRYPNSNSYNTVLMDKLSTYNPTLIILAGFMKLIPIEITSIYKNLIINIHPGKIPDFGGKGLYGINVHKAVIAEKCEETAVTIHYVNEEYDKGQIIHEEIIKIYENETPEDLSARVLKYEHKVYSHVINKLLKGMN